MAGTDLAVGRIESENRSISLSELPCVNVSRESATPPYPSDTKAGGFRFELNIERMHQSDTWAIAEAHLRPFLVMIWIVSWTQLPAGSLPNSDAVISARIGMPKPVFTENKHVLMRGWWQANDGRLYHPVLTELVLEMIQRKARKATNQANYRDRQRQQGSAGANKAATPVEASATGVTGHIRVTDPDVIGHQVVTDSTTTTTITTTEEEQEQVAEPKGSTQSQMGEQDRKSRRQVEADVLIGIPLKDGSEYAITGTEIAEWVAAYPNKDVMSELRQARAWSVSNPTRRKTRRRVLAFLNGWIAREFAPDQRRRQDYFNPGIKKFDNIKGGLL